MGKWRHLNTTSLYPIRTPSWAPIWVFILVPFTSQTTNLTLAGGWGDRGGNNMIWNTFLNILRLCKVFSQYILQMSYLEAEDGQMGGCNIWKLSELSQLFNQQLISSWLAVVNENNTPVAHKKSLIFQNLSQSPMSESQFAPLANLTITLGIRVMRNHRLTAGDGRKKSAGMSGSKKNYIFPHVMGWPSLHIHEHRASITARVIRVLALTCCCSPKGDKSHWRGVCKPSAGG